MRKLSLKIALTPPKYKCVYCGRELLYKVAHKCKDGFRKRHLKFYEII